VAGNGHVEAIKVLVQLGLDKEAKRAAGSTALHIAAYIGQVEAIKLLVQLGADKEAKDAYGATPLHWAAYNGQVEAMDPEGSPSGGAGVAGAGTHRTRTEGGG
jgi:ankyrin repeat protein